MLNAITIALLPLLALPAQAQTLTEKLCIFASAQKLPAIPGLSIAATRVKDVPKDAKQAAPGITGLMVEIDVRAANQDATFAFVCATAPGKPTFVESMGISR
jgi:hypothetical protein